MRLLKRLTLLPFFSLVMLFSAHAQDTGAIMGVVTDATGAVMPGVTVKITNVGTGYVREVLTNESGRYVAEALPVGIYDIAAEQPGFKRFVRKGVKLDVRDRLHIDIVLEVGELAEVITVEAEPPRVQTETGEVSYFISGKQITELAINGRNFVQLARLAPGTSNLSRSDEVGVGVTGRKAVAINGLGEGYSGWLIDGAQNTDVGSQGTLNTYPAIEAIGEFKMLTSNYSAEYGTAGGANITIVTKSGTKDFHGSAYEFLRNDAMDARNFFARGVPPLKLNNFGYTLGGPFYIPGKYNTEKDKTFFFWSQEWRIIRRGTTILATTPTEAMRRGDFRDEAARIGRPIIDPRTGQPFPDNIIPADRINSNAKILLDTLFPLPNRAGFPNFGASPSQPTSFRQELIRVDHNFTEKMKLMGRYIHDSFDDTPVTTLWTGSAFPTVNATIDTPGQNFILKLTNVISPKTVNEFNYNVTSDRIRISLNGAFQRPPNLTIKELFPENRQNRIPDLFFAQGFGGISAGSWPWRNNNMVHTWYDYLSKVVGNHSLKMGAQYQFQVKNQEAFGPTQGNFFFSGKFTNHAIADFLLGLPSSYTELDIFREGQYRYHQFEAFIQDDWKVNKHLTLNIGMRYFYIPHVFEKNDSLTAFYPDRYDPTKAPIVNPDGTIVPESIKDPLNGLAFAGKGVPRGFTKNFGGRNWAPRFAFSYDPTGAGKWAIRGGYGIGYYRVEGNDIYDLINNPPFARQVSITDPPLDNPAAGVAAPLRPLVLRTFDFEYWIPTAQTFSFGVQREIARDTILEIAWVGSRGTHLDWRVNINQPPPVGGFDFDPRINVGRDPVLGTLSVDFFRPFRGWASIFQQQTTGSSNYHSLQINFDKRFSRGLKFQAAYTFSKGIGTVFDSGGRSVGQQPQNPYNLRAERGLLGFDRTHVMVINYIYELPFLKGRSDAIGKVFGGWQISGITEFSSGPTASPGLSIAQQGLASRPNRISDKVEGPKTVDQWFNTAAFSAPAHGFYGNAGRNIIREPGVNRWDISLFKNHYVREDVNIQFRAEFFNAWNHPSFNLINTTLGAGAYGKVVSAREGRVIQFGLKLSF